MKKNLEFSIQNSEGLICPPYQFYILIAVFCLLISVTGFSQKK